MRLRVMLDNGDPLRIVRGEEHGFATWCMMICNEGFTTDDGRMYLPGRRIRAIHLETGGYPSRNLL